MAHEPLHSDELGRALTEAVAPLDPRPPDRDAVLAAGRARLGRRRARTLAAAAFGAVAAATVAVVIAVLPSHGGDQTNPGTALPTTKSATTTSAPSPSQITAPASGMPGQVQVAAAAFPSAGHGVVLISQCYPCQARSGTYTNWIALTNDGGHTWTTKKTDLRFADRDTGLHFADADNGWMDGGYVTHDGGRSWHKATTPQRVDTVDVAGGRVWALTDCSSCRATQVLSGAASSDTLAPASAQPFSGYAAGRVTAVDADTAYVWAATDTGTRIVATSDGGRTWQTITPGCAAPYAGVIEADSPTSLWQLCQGGPVQKPGLPKAPPGDGVLERSLDAGAHWTQYPLPERGLRPAPVSQQVAWSAVDQVYRTTDGGQTWQTVWNPYDARPVGSPEPGTLEAFDAQATDRAQAVLAFFAPSGTYLAVYRTTDGGLTWQPQLVPLPAQ